MSNVSFFNNTNIRKRKLDNPAGSTSNSIHSSNANKRNRISTELPVRAIFDNLKSRDDSSWMFDSTRLSSNKVRQAQLTNVIILGLKKDEALRRLHDYACNKCYNKQEFLNYTNLILQHCDPKKSHLCYIKRLIEHSMYIIVGPSFSFFQATMDILKSMLSLLQRITEENSSFIDFILRYIINFTFVLMDQTINVREIAKLKGFLKRTVKLEKRDCNGNDLLLLACLSTSKVDWFHRMHRWNITLFERVVSVLLALGADPNSMNAYGRTAIHILSHSEDFGPAVRLFYKAGANFD